MRHLAAPRVDPVFPGRNLLWSTWGRVEERLKLWRIHGPWDTLVFVTQRHSERFGLKHISQINIHLNRGYNVEMTNLMKSGW